MRIARAAVVLALMAGTALAQPARSTQLFEEGRALAAKKKYAAACEKFEESLALDRAGGTLLNYGDCLEKLGQLRKAWQMYDAAAKLFARDLDERAKFARSLANDVEPKLVRVVLKVEDPDLAGLVIMIGDTSVAPREKIAELVEPGDVEITARADGHEDFVARASGDAGTSVRVTIPANLGDDRRPVEAVTTREDARDNGDAEVGERSAGRVKLAFVGGGVGIIALGVGVGLGLSGKFLYDDALAAGDCREVTGQLVCNGRGKANVEAAATRANIGTGFVVGGAVLAVAAIVIYVTAPREHAATSVSVSPTVGPEGIGMAFSGRF